MFRCLEGYMHSLGKRGKLSRGGWGVIFERGVREGTARRKNSDLNVDHCRGYKTDRWLDVQMGIRKRLVLWQWKLFK